MKPEITYVLLLFALLYHVAYDLHKQKEAKPIVHWLSALLVLGISSLAGFINSVLVTQYWWQFTAFSLCIHFALFDIIWNAAHGEKWNYHGNPPLAWTDKAWQQIPGAGEILFRLIFLYLGYAVYYKLPQIIG